MDARSVAQEFRRQFGRSPALLVRAPGRVNLIGEHTDYSGGWVLPAAIDRAVFMAISLRDDDELRIRACDLGQGFSGSLANVGPSPLGWPNYLLGCFSELRREGCPLRGADIAFGGDIPMGAGLSSSAAIESGLLFALNELGGLGYAREALAVLAQRAENRFVGTQCGIMDMFASLLGREGCALQLDCSNLEHAYVPVEMGEFCLLLCDTGVKHELAGSEYNTRRGECEEGLRLLQAKFPALRLLREARPAMLRELGDAKLRRRCQFVTEENERVLRACALLRSEGLSAIGPLLYASHEGLRGLYEVSCPELDFLTGLSRRFPGSLGARMVGGGFGGCTLHLLEKRAAPRFAEEAGQLYLQKWGRQLRSWEIKLSGGVNVVGEY